MENNLKIQLSTEIIKEMPRLANIHSFKAYLQKKERTDLSFEPIDVLYFTEYLKGLRKFTQNTIYDYIVAVRSYCNVHFTRNPDPVTEVQFGNLFRKLRVNRPYTVLQPDDVFNPDEINKLIDIADNVKTKAFILGLFFTIARIQEAVEIKLSHCKVLDEDVTEIRILHGKGNRERTVGIPTEIFNEIKRIFNSRIYLFESETGKHYNPRTIGGHLRDLGNKYGKRLTPHLLRHSGVTFLIQQKVDLTTISKLVGTSIPVLLKTYNHPKVDKKEILSILKKDIKSNPFRRKR
jgi:integrase